MMSFIFGLIAACALPHTGPLGNFDIPAPFLFIAFSVGITGLFWNLRTHQKSYLTAFVHGYAWAFGYFLLSLAWIGNALLIDGNPYAWAYPLALIGLPFLLSFYLGVFYAIFAPFLRKLPPPYAGFLFISLFSLSEYARGHLFTGFPWNLPAFIWSETLPIFQTLSATGPYGLTYLTLLWALVPFFIFGPDCQKGRSFIFIFAATFTLFLSLLYGYVQLQTPISHNKTFQAVLVQANIPQSEKWEGTKMVDHFYNHLERSRPPKELKDIPTLILWPETALPPAYVNAPAVRRGMAAILKDYPIGSWIVTGALRADGNLFYNSVIAYNAEGESRIIYDKHHLVPFGEYIPFQSYIPIAPITQFDGLASGLGPKTIRLENLPTFSPLICYEAIFANEMRSKDAEQLELLVNLTNDSWYGNSAGPYQHLAQARARAIEQGLPFLRVAETGISAAIDSKGHFDVLLPYGQEGTEVITISYNNNPETFYQLYGDHPFLFLLFSTLLLVVLRFWH